MIRAGTIGDAFVRIVIRIAFLFESYISRLAQH